MGTTNHNIFVDKDNTTFSTVIEVCSSHHFTANAEIEHKATATWIFEQVYAVSTGLKSCRFLRRNFLWSAATAPQRKWEQGPLKKYMLKKSPNILQEPASIWEWQHIRAKFWILSSKYYLKTNLVWISILAKYFIGSYVSHLIYIIKNFL